MQRMRCRMLMRDRAERTTSACQSEELGRWYVPRVSVLLYQNCVVRSCVVVGGG